MQTGNQVDESSSVETLVSRMEFMEDNDDFKKKHLQSPIIISTLPPMTNVNGPLGRRTQCCVWPGFKEAVLAQPDFPKPILLPSESLCRLQRVDDNIGMGLFATRFIAAGQLVLAERPLFIAQPRGSWPASPVKPLEEMTHDEMRAAVASDVERMLSFMVDRMVPEDQVAFRSLANSHQHDGSPPLLGIWRTNGLEVDGLLRLMPGIPYDEEHWLSAVCEVLSRLNHSCSPNTTRHFDAESFSFILRAVRDIPAGTELTLQYCDTLLPAADRQKELNPYGFLCTCTSCKNPSISDPRRARIAATPLPDFTLKDWIDNPSLPDDHITRRTLESIALIEAEGLEALEDYRDHFIMLHMAYAALGDSVNYNKYTNKAAKVYLTCGGHGSAQMAVLLTAMASNPALNPKWEKRLKLKGWRASSLNK